MLKLSLTVALLLLCVAAPASAQQKKQIPRPEPGGRIQLDLWRSVTVPDIQDPLTQIVRIYRGGASGTGFFLDNCRVITNLHVLLMIKKQMTEPKLDFGETLIGDSFEYVTQPIPWRNNERAHGEFVVLAHGAAKRYTEEEKQKARAKGTGEETISKVEKDRYADFDNGSDDWAIGFDERCLSRALSLGYLTLGSGLAQLPNLFSESFFTAGYSAVVVEGTSEDAYPLYIDSDCHLNKELTSTQYRDWGEVWSDCSLWHGGSGQPIFLQIDTNPKHQSKRVYNGRPQRTAIGIASAGYGNDFNGLSSRTKFTLFTSQFLLNILPAIMPIDIDSLRRLLPNSHIVDPKPAMPIRPPYPEAARQSGIEGNVIVEIELRHELPDHPYNWNVIKGLSPELDIAANIAVADSQFYPATVNGNPIAAKARIVVPFTLPR